MKAMQTPKVPLRWVVEEPTQLAQLLRRLEIDPEAVRDGRVFVNRRRVRGPSIRLSTGSVVDIHPAPESSDGRAVRIIDRREGMIALDKPAGVSAIPDQRGDQANVLSRLAAEFGVPVDALHPTSRLDRDVSGVMIVATDAQGGEALRIAREQGLYRRRYVAIAQRSPERESGRIDAPIGRGSGKARQVEGRDAVACVTRYSVVARARSGVLIAAEPETGRTHQIRVHLAHVGAPLLGDRLYGHGGSVTDELGAVHAVDRIALHAARVQVTLANDDWVVESPIPDELTQLWEIVGGMPVDWERIVRNNLNQI